MGVVIHSLPGAWGTLLMVLRIALVVWAVVGVVLAARAPAGAYVAEGRWSKPGWIAVCAVSAIVFWFMGPLSLLGVVGLVAVGVFFADVRPAVGGPGR